MSGRAVEMPPVNVAAAMLRKTTERLAQECVQPSASAPEWSDVEWAIACAAAAMQGISVLLANSVAWSGPSFWEDFLAEQREQSQLRDAKVGALLERLDDALRTAGCGVLALKGASLRQLNLYRRGERSMSDIDLLAREADVAAVAEALGRLGYVHSQTTPRHAIFEPLTKQAPASFAEHADHPLRVEVHTKISERLPVREVDITRCLPHAARAGINYYAAAPLLLHSLLHVSGNMWPHGARQIKIQDIALLASRMDDRAWGALLYDRDRNEPRWWLYPPLAITSRYYESAIPVEVLTAARSVCGRRLRNWIDRRTLTDVSWSNLRIHPFLGIAWARTLADAAALVHGRVWQSRAEAVENQKSVQADEQLRRIEWYRISRRRRIWRWLTLRAPRPLPMWSLEAALRNAQGSVKTQ